MRRTKATQRAVIETLEQRALLSGNGLAGAYFNGTDLTDVKLARTDAQVGFDWSAGPPTAAVGSDYSVRWSGRFQARYNEQYRFALLNSGSVRLWVNGSLIIDDWTNHALKVDSGYINLQAGKRYDMRLEYATTGGQSLVRMYEQSDSQAKVTVPRGDLYSSPVEFLAPPMPRNFRTSYVTDTTVKVIWSAVTDASGPVLYDVYIGKTKVATTSATNYTRSGRVASTAYSFSVRAVDIFGNAGKTAAITATTLAPAVGSGGTGLAAKYYAGNDYNQYEATRTDSTVDFNFSSAPVATSDGTFSVVWSGFVIPKYTEQYTFFVSSDDGDRLTVNGSVLFDHFQNPSGTEDSGTITLLAGHQYPISLQYHNASGGGNVHLSWMSLSQTKQIIPASQLVPEFVDKNSPSVPSGVSISGVGSTTVSLGWNAASDDVGIASYDVYRNSQKVANVGGTSYDDSGLSASTQYQYYIIARDGASHASSASSTVTATTNAIVASRDALNSTSAASFDGSAGVSTSGGNVTSFDSNDWIRFDGMDFHGGVNSVKITLALPTTAVGGSIELHLDSVSGPRIGTVVVQPTGSYSTYYIQQTEITGASGVHSLYLVGKNKSSLANIQSIQFSNASLVKIMPLGDSITEEFSSSPSWRYYLYNDLISEGKSVDFVGSQTQATDDFPPNLNFDQNHEGHSGWTTAQLLAALPGFLSQNVPDIVLLHIGSNDLRTGVDQQTAINNISSIINTLRGANSNVKIILAQILPIAAVDDSIVQAFNSQIASLASSKGVNLVDQHTGFNINTDSDDGLHPNDSGDQKMAAKWNSALLGVL